VARHLIATGFFAIGTKTLNVQNRSRTPWWFGPASSAARLTGRAGTDVTTTINGYIK